MPRFDDEGRRSPGFAEEVLPGGFAVEIGAIITFRATLQCRLVS